MKIIDNISDNKLVKGVKSVNIKDFASGRILLKNFVIRQGKLVVLILICTFFYMDNRMICEKELREIDHLNEQLVDAKYICTLTETELLKSSTHSEIDTLVKSKQLNLIDLDLPPYKINK